LITQGNAANSSETSMATQPGGSVTSRAASESRAGVPTNGIHPTGAKFRHGLLQLMIHTIDPLHDGNLIAYLLHLKIIVSLPNSTF
jgi:solute carrier family 24 (sodium/potassium/calcium exchanger), member 2